MTIFVILRQTECFSDSLHIIGVATDIDTAQYIADVTGDLYSPCTIEEYDTDTITRDSLLKYQVFVDGGELFATYVGDEIIEDKNIEQDFKSAIIYARNHKEALSLAKDVFDRPD